MLFLTIFVKKITDLNFANETPIRKIHKKMFSLNFLKKLIHGVTMDVAVNLF